MYMRDKFTNMSDNNLYICDKCTNNSDQSDNNIYIGDKRANVSGNRIRTSVTRGKADLDISTRSHHAGHLVFM